MKTNYELFGIQRPSVRVDALTGLAEMAAAVSNAGGLGISGLTQGTPDGLAADRALQNHDC